MTHSFDFVGLNEKLFLLRHLISGTREYCKKEKLFQGSKEYDDEEWNNYSMRLRYLVSNDLIESATKLRVMQDTSLAQVPIEYIRELDSECLTGLRVGKILQGNFKLSLRESCNKVIHATKFELIISNSRNAKPYYRYSYWNGRCLLSGSQNKSAWQLELNVYDWCDAMDYFLEDLSGNVDW